MNVTGNNIYKLLTSLRTAIFLLSFIAATSIFGTVIKQRADVDEYLSVYSEGTYRFIRFFGFDDAYHSPWFIAAIVLFAINLFFCTIGRFKRFQKTHKNHVTLPDEKSLSVMQMHFYAEKTIVGHIINSLKTGYKTVYKEEKGVVLEKGAISRYGVYIIHTSILIILAGSLVGLVFGYKGFMILNKGETGSVMIMRGNEKKKLPLGFDLRCRDFRVSFYPGGTPKDYVSRIEVIENNRIVSEKDIRVNDPLNYKGTYIHQASYGSVPSFIFSIDGDKIALKERDTYEKNGLVLMVVGSEDKIHNFGPGVQVTYLDQDEPKTVWFLKNVKKMKERNIRGVNIRFEDITENYYTGLEVSRDPGVWIVWTGFASILIGLYINFFMYCRRIYIRETADGVIVAGRALRNHDAFKEEFEKLKKKVLRR